MFQSRKSTHPLQKPFQPFDLPHTFAEHMKQGFPVQRLPRQKLQHHLLVSFEHSKRGSDIMGDGGTQNLLILYHPPHFPVVLCKLIFHPVKFQTEFSQFIPVFIPDFKVQIIACNLFCRHPEGSQWFPDFLLIKQHGGHNDPTRAHDKNSISL